MMTNEDVSIRQNIIGKISMEKYQTNNTWKVKIIGEDILCNK